MQEKFNQYYLTRELANKHSRSTYLASPINPQREHGEPERQVVLTVFSASLFRLPYERENLLEKAQRIKQLQHAHLVPILDIGIEKEQPFVVREYLPNGSLRSRLKQISPRRLELEDALTIVLQVGEALAYAHEHNVLHSNLKPENILFDATGQIFLTDFTIVGRKDAIIRDQTSGEYAFCYMAPEQFAGTCDARSDQYALGCLAYELITGHVPFASQTLASMMGQPNNVLPAPLSESVADLPPSLEIAIFKTLAKDPDQRFFDFSLFLEVIQSVLSPPPAFPLFRSIHSHKHRFISYPARSAKAKTIFSSIRKHGVLELTETVEAFSITESNITQHADKRQKHSRSSAIMLEAMPQSVLTPELSISAPLIEEAIDDVSLNDPFRQEEVDGSLGIGSPRSLVHNPSESGAGWIGSSSMSIIDLPRPRTIQTLPNRKKVLALTLLLSTIVALLAYTFWPFETTHLDTSHSAQEIIHGLIPQIPMQAGNIPTNQTSARDTNNLTVQGATNNPQAQSPSQTTSKQAPSSSSPSSSSSSSPSSSSSSSPSSSSSSSSLPTPSSSQGSTTTTNMTVYFGGWTDNSPPGASIAYPQIHQTAGGTGTYSDPITFAASKNALSPGTIIYISFLKKYFTMEDDCGSCDSAWNNNHTYEITLWIGGDANSSSSALQSCENSLTPNSAQPVQIQPPSNNAVNTTPLFTDSGGCIKL